ncbi:hypothetical protein LP316_01005 [Thalassotalea sp. LPB0316]|uniref:hypothetical protein n=1 Tax=Thalassotalea sp. LPB0316 TaxID=2769490 RepID=UPI0018692B5F|nr:hypothetical protein [Thalassotalea sp. LPB0316]QOL25927.1 hypothetical protein LP316_01005 [Thalassotalea sp. LPB0316]
MKSILSILCVASFSFSSVAAPSYDDIKSTVNDYLSADKDQVKLDITEQVSRNISDAVKSIKVLLPVDNEQRDKESEPSN